MQDKKKTTGESAEKSTWPEVNIGNASNPSPEDDNLDPSPGSQLLNDRAEKYLREAANIEDLPDAEDQKEMNETLEQNRQSDSAR